MTTDDYNSENYVDTRGPAVVLIGGPIEGYKVYGPFDTIDQAARWFEKTQLAMLGKRCSIMLVEDPNSERRAT